MSSLSKYRERRAYGGEVLPNYSQEDRTQRFLSPGSVAPWQTPFLSRKHPPSLGSASFSSPDRQILPEAVTGNC